MGYKEEIFERVERTGITNRSAILTWLRKDRTGKTVRIATPGLRGLSDDLSAPFKISDKIDKAETSVRISEIREEIEALEVDRRSELGREADLKLREIQRVEKTLLEEASTMAVEDEKISRIVTTEEERQELTLREKQILGSYMKRLR